MKEFAGVADLTQNEDQVLVSAIVPTYEDAEYLGSAIESIAAQTYRNVEIVIVDSSGVEWLAETAADTPGITYSYQEPQGLAAARNHGIDIAAGDVIAFLDADDRWHPEKLEQQLPYIEDGADVVYSDTYVVRDDGKQRHLSALPVSDPDRHYLEFLYEGGVPILTVIASRECLDAERFNEELPAVEDRNLLVRLFERYTPAKVAEPLAYYRQRQTSMSSDAETMYEAELASLRHLADTLPVVADRLDELEALAEYKYGKRLLRGGEAARARRHLLEAVRAGHRDLRTVLLLAISFLPFGHRSALWGVERIQNRLRSISKGRF